MKNRLICGIGVVATAATVAIVFSVTAFAIGDGPGCADGSVCWWSQQNYEGQKASDSTYDNGNWVAIPYQGSAKNRFLGRKVVLGNSPAHERVGCMDPGDNRPDLGNNAAVYKVGAVGSRC